MKVKSLVEDVRLRPGPAATLPRGSIHTDVGPRLAYHFTRHSLHVGQFSTRRAKPAAWNGFQAARTAPADTCTFASALLRTSAITTPRVKTIRRGSRASPGHRGNG